ncbi:MAG: B12-binding domain-containing radical SAM protein [Candidatus Omnitrophica bacterium CG11_big_fil_rev_8_21_14_0_20_42_13]|uniref:B12-binding domain-containing radical SAM protein n=1 Tax=Candidatus Ghiorseimicrobium undicola TaxID=1974746 RepID=A0A2H0LYW6_9BACT|nr:MAG: B12-binding domain-containing radical SAM protein [Candidatus Omnitrophica bacterium CG11_big_fil_rev_8_21_14_0_20_42_13]
MPEKIDLVLINPGNRRASYAGLGNELAGIEPPIWCALIAAFIRKHGYSVGIVDADVDNLSPEEAAEKIIRLNPLLAGIVVLGTNPSASSTPKMPAARNLLNALSKNNNSFLTILSGLHPSALPERTLNEENVDFVCQGEGFYTFLDLLAGIKSGNGIKQDTIPGLWYRSNGKPVLGTKPSVAENLDGLPFAAWDLLPMEKYRAHNWHCFDNLKARSPYAVVYTSLGCPFKCSYCNIHALYDGGPGIRFRSIRNVISEIDMLVENYKIRNFKILDELFVLNEDRVMEFCDLMIKRNYGLNIWAYARADTVGEKILTQMKKAGINWLAYGFESGSAKVRRSVTKGRLTPEIIKKAVDATHKAGIHIVANFIFGLPEDDLTTMQETLDTAKELNCEYANFYVAMAYPGSRLYEEAICSGVELPESWSGYAQFSEETLPLATKYLSSAEVLRFRDKAFYDYHHRAEYLEMIEEKFGKDSAEYIKNMLKYKINRKFAYAKDNK